MEAKERVDPGMKSAIREILETVILTIVIFLLVRAIVQNFKVEGLSMEPTLENGQYLLVTKASYWRLEPRDISQLVPWLFNDNSTKPLFVLGRPQRGEVIVFRYPKDLSRDFIKRVIAVPGDTVEIKNSHVYVNGEVLDEPYISDEPNYYLAKQVIPPGNYFVLGDNRNNSLDSHVWGNVPIGDVIGKAWFCYWPVERWGLIENTAAAQQAP